MSAYRAFAAYYDRLTQEIDYPGRAAYFDRLIRQNLAVDGGTILLDLACGKGLIAAMHLKDTMPGEYRLTRYGEGHVDFPRSVELIQQLGIRIFTAELFCQPQLDWKAEAIRVNRFLRGFFH